MPKLNQKFPSELDIEDLHVKDNIRKDYRDIPELAASFQKVGQVHAIGIDKDYNIIVGHRRYRAAVHLLEEKGIRIKLRVHLIQGDRKTLQAIENFHQSKMTASEEEQCIESFIADGMKQKEIAEYLCLTPQRVNDMRAGGRTREKLESLGISTNEISTSGLSAARNVPEEKLIEVIDKANESGGTSVGNIKKAVKEITEPKKEKSKTRDITFNDEVEEFILNPKVMIICYRNCNRKNRDNRCMANNITIDENGICGNFEEV